MLFRTCLFALSLLTFACSDAQSPEQTNEQIQTQLDAITRLEANVFPKGLQEGTDTTRGWPYVRAVEAFTEAHPKNEVA